MKLRICSDIHLDHDNPKSIWTPAKEQFDSDSVLVVAGDLWSDRRLLRNTNGPSWLQIVSEQFAAVVLVLGNHDYWGCNISNEVDKCHEEMSKQGLTNCHLLENSSVVIDDVKFVGATLWTNYNKGDPLAMWDAKSFMNDFSKIRKGGGYSRLTTYDVHNIHVESKQHIFENAIRDFPEQKVVVVSHHLPSYQSIAPHYRTASNAGINFSYYSELSDRILGSDIDLWVHGHSHDRADYEVGTTRIVCNPRGYASESHYSEFDEHFSVEV